MPPLSEDALTTAWLIRLMVVPRSGEAMRRRDSSCSRRRRWQMSTVLHRYSYVRFMAPSGHALVHCECPLSVVEADIDYRSAKCPPATPSATCSGACGMRDLVPRLSHEPHQTGDCVCVLHSSVLLWSTDLSAPATARQSIEPSDFPGRAHGICRGRHGRRSRYCARTPSGPDRNEVGQHGLCRGPLVHGLPSRSWRRVHRDQSRQAPAGISALISWRRNRSVDDRPCESIHAARKAVTGSTVAWRLRPGRRFVCPA